MLSGGMLVLTKIRCYQDISKLKSFLERFNYLKLDGYVGDATFGYQRYLNQFFYQSEEWKRARREVILRDNGCDLGIEGREIMDRVYIHHMNPITPQDIEERTRYLLDPEYLICVSHDTHNAIHYGNQNNLIFAPADRSPNDTSPWRK